MSRASLRRSRLSLQIVRAVFTVTLSCIAGSADASVEHCVQIGNRSTDEVRFVNVCNEKIFVIYCGSLKYDKRHCGEGPGGGYHTHSFILQPNADRSIMVKGPYRYGVCAGGIDFGGRGKYYLDASDGTYECLAR